jgi:hypothetical protein
MKTKNLERYLNSVGKQVVNRAKGGLQKKKGGGSRLEESIKFKVVRDKKGFIIQFLMSSYGKFVDKGVSGTDIRRKYKDSKNQIVSSPYRFRGKQPPSRVLDKWIVKKGIAPRDDKGRFTSRKSISFLIARSIKKKGIQGISFFQKPFGLAMKTFNQGVSQAIAKDIADNLKNNKNKK